MSTGSVTIGADTVSFTIPDTYLHPVVQFSTLTKATDTSIQQAFARLSAASIVQMPAGTFTFSDFAQGGGVYGIYAQNLMGIIGAGIGQTILQMVPSSSTKTAPTTGTNQLTLLRIGNSPSLGVSTGWLQDFTLQGTSQGHAYNGLQLYCNTGSTLLRVQVNAIPGTASSPPGETFHYNLYKGSGNMLTGCIADGANIGASGFGTNTTESGDTFTNCIAENMLKSAGWAFNTGANMTMTNCITTGNVSRDINFEQMTGELEVNGHTFGTASIPIAITNNSGWATLSIMNPFYAPNPLLVRAFATFDSGSGAQPSLQRQHLDAITSTVPLNITL